MRWRRHRERLLEIFVASLTFSTDIIGMLVCEVGSVRDPYDEEDRKKFDNLFKEAFNNAARNTGAAEHTEVQIFWATGNAAETVMVFKSHIKVTILPTFHLQHPQHDWRRIEVALIKGATEHDPEVSLIIYNTHQPSSPVHSWGPFLRKKFCKTVLLHALRTHAETQNNLGFLVAGDANCSRVEWTAACFEQQDYKLHFQEPEFIYANEHFKRHPAEAKGGDIGVVMGIKTLKGRQYDFKRQSREKQHDVMIIGWSWTGAVKDAPLALPARKQARTCEGASEHAISTATAEPSETSAPPLHEQNAWTQEEPAASEQSATETEEAHRSRLVQEVTATHQTFTATPIPLDPVDTSSKEDTGASEHIGTETEEAQSDSAPDDDKAEPEEVDDDKAESEPDDNKAEPEEVDANATTEKQAEEIWMASQLLWMVSQVLRAFADTKFWEQARSTVSDAVMPDDFAARIMNCNVLVPGVVQVMTDAVQNLFVCRPPPNTGATEHGQPALRMKEPEEIQARWQELFDMRRQFEPDDMKAIRNADTLAAIHNAWMSNWLERKLNYEQRRKPRSSNTSFFSAWLRNNYGSKRFVIAILETGFSWSTPTDPASSAGDLCQRDIAIGAPEHTIARFIDWILQVVKTIDTHKKEPTVEEQRRRSGDQKHKSGLTEEEKMLRKKREEARANFQYGADLHRRLELEGGKGKARGKGKHDSRLSPLAWNAMSQTQRWYLQEYWSGNLKKTKDQAEAQYCPKSAATSRFRMQD